MKLVSDGSTNPKDVGARKGYGLPFLVIIFGNTDMPTEQ